MAYLLDSNVFISAKNDYYGFDFCPGFWDWLEMAGARGIVYSVEAVYDEITKGEDELSEWAKAHAGFFMPETKDALSAIASVNNWATAQDYSAAAKRQFATGADSFLIAQAKAGGHTVVTHETTRSRGKIKIPNAAIANGVRCIGPFEMLRAEQVRLVLAGRA